MNKEECKTKAMCGEMKQGLEGARGTDKGSREREMGEKDERAAERRNGERR